MIRIWIDEEGVVRLRASGLLDPAAVIRAHEDFYEEHWDAYVEADRHLADYRGVDLTHMESDHIRTLASRNVEIAEVRPPLQIAVLVDPGVAYGFARMWEQYAFETGWPLKLFTDEDAAWAWLQEGDGAA